MPGILPPPLPLKASPDPDDEPMQCEVCGGAMRKGDSFSFILGWGTTGPVPIAAFTCGGGHYGTGQHFTCSRKCAIAAAAACIDEHLAPRHESHYQERLRTASPEDRERWDAHAHRYRDEHSAH